MASRLLAPLACLFLAGCATGEEGLSTERPGVRGGEFGRPDCFWVSPALDFEVLDSRNLIVFASGRRDAYHVQVGFGSVDLRFVSSLGFVSSGSRVCGHAGDAVLVRNGPGPGADRLPVVGVYRLDATGLAGLRSRFGREPPADKTEPQPGPGPVIERELENGDDPPGGTAQQP